MLTSADFEAHIKSESARSLECLRNAAPDTPVPSCPGWTAQDLMWHVTEGQSFWAAIVSQRLQSPDSVFADRRTGPGPDEDPAQLCADSTAALLASLDGVPDDTEIWTWADDHTVGFIRRRQAHESLIHRLDAESMTTDNAVVDPVLATDGIDEVLHLMHGGANHEGFEPDGRTCRITTLDTGASWDLAFGSKPNGDGFVVAQPGEVHTHDLVLVHDAAHLDAWLWGRGFTANLETVGDTDLLARLEAIMVGGA